MCMEPLIKNIEKNPEIEPIFSREVDSNLPKIYAYADDVNCVTKASPSCIQKVFEEYERLTKLSGLMLNADKTEILNVKSTNLRLLNHRPYRVTYLGEAHQDAVHLYFLIVLKLVSLAEVCDPVRTMVEQTEIS